MSTATSPAQPVSTTGTAAVQPALPAEIDASCRAPLLFQFFCASAWLLSGAVLALIASIKFHSPGFLADCPSMTYGRIYPAAMNAIVYGFAIQSGLGVALWILARLGRTKLVGSGAVVIATIFWNLGVKAGVLGILFGDSTGFAWLETPRYASPILFCSFAILGVGGLLAFQRRSQDALYPSQWFLLAALFWFPWIYSTANALLVCAPVRGVAQASVNWWFANNLFTIVLGFIGIGTIFYFIPKLSARPLHSHYSAMFAFWTLALFGSWMGVPSGAPVPAWLPAVGTVSAVMTLVPMVAVATNCHQTLAGNYSKLRSEVPLRFVVVGAVCLIAAALMLVAGSFRDVSAVTQFTWFTRAQTDLFLLGFFAMTMFGAIYHIVQRLVPAEALCPRMTRLHFWSATTGVVLLVAPLAIGGIREGQALADSKNEFMTVVKWTAPMLRASTTGDLFIAAGAAMLFLNMCGAVVSCCRACCASACAKELKAAEVVS